MINKADILNKSRVFSLDEMRAYLENSVGRTLTAAQADKLLRDALPKESYFQSNILRWLKENYPAAFVWKVQTGPYARQGVPDICAVIDGHFYGFEIKRPFVGRVSRIQQNTMEAIEKAGGRAGVVVWPEDARKMIENE
ncbi:MAG: VRR-NUC domain-containing protein [Oscillospiraceae bacterium]|nr:VRR-NUC domain-containing protein [Oscillospiraceae bacterium]